MRDPKAPSAAGSSAKRMAGSARGVVAIALDRDLARHASPDLQRAAIAATPERAARAQHDLLDDKVAIADQLAAHDACCLGDQPGLHDPCGWLAEVAHIERLVDVQGSRLAVSAEAAPIVDAIGRV